MPTQDPWELPMVSIPTVGFPIGGQAVCLGPHHPAWSREETRMPLPVRTAVADIEAICAYLIVRPDGASPGELISEKALDRRKLFALKFWG